VQLSELGGNCPHCALPGYTPGSYDTLLNPFSQAVVPAPTQEDTKK